MGDADRTATGGEADSGEVPFRRVAIVGMGLMGGSLGLAAGEAIRAGTGYGVFAGLDVQMEAWEASARVSAPQRPEGLMSGWWAGPSPC